MKELILVPSRWRLAKGMAFCLLGFLLMISLAFQVDLFGGSVGFYGFFPDHPIWERAVGYALLGALSVVLADMIIYMIWRTPVVVGTEEGLHVKGRFIPWSEFKGVRLQRVTTGHVGAANFLKVRGRRTVTIKDHEMSGRPQKMADDIMDYANEAMRAAATRPAFVVGAEADKIRPRRPKVSSRAGIRPGVI